MNARRDRQRSSVVSPRPEVSAAPCWFTSRSPWCAHRVQRAGHRLRHSVAGAPPGAELRRCRRDGRRHFAGVRRLRRRRPAAKASAMNAALHELRLGRDAGHHAMPTSRSRRVRRARQARRSETPCIRVDVFRNQRPDGKPLPTIFGTPVQCHGSGRARRRRPPKCCSATARTA